jgi:hypothetical protein
MYVLGTIKNCFRWLLSGLLELFGVRMWDERKTGMRDHVVAAELELNRRIDTEAQSLSLTKDQVDMIRQPSVRVAIKGKAD